MPTRALLALAAVLWSLGSLFTRLLTVPLGLGLDEPTLTPLQLAFFRNLFAADAIEVNSVKHIIISSVVPPVDSILREVCKRYFGVTPLFVEPGVKTGMPVQSDQRSKIPPAHLWPAAGSH